ncbi:alcohol dehydrogenase [Streptomyces sp. NPDC008222]|uniref:alcohol dehydrogenase n=1 Tax=Streptomyces sp. NPDC008222 TaxID=3364820 RepID=UPI0036EE79CB
MPSVISAAIGGLSPRGVLGTVGAQTDNLVLAPMDLAVGRKVTGILEGDAVPQQLIPLLIRLWQQGRFPFDKLIEVYPLSDIDEAECASRSGNVLKPVMLPG